MLPKLKKLSKLRKNKVAKIHKRLHFLDLLRGLMALCVVLYHTLHYEEIITLYAVGRYAVYSFFVLSGLSLYYVYRDKFKSLKETKNYFIRRYFRIAPLLYLVIFLIVVSDIVEGEGDFEYTRASFTQLFLNYSLLFGFFNPGETSIAPASWSLGIEWVFYTIFPLLLVLTRKSLVKLCVLTAVFFGMHVWYLATAMNMDETLTVQWVKYTQPVTFFVYFAFGMIGAELYYRFQHKNMPQKTFIAICIACFAFLFLGPQTSNIDVLKGNLSYLFFAACIIPVIVGAFITIRHENFKRLSIFLGNVSYGVYLFHVPLYSMIENLDLGAFSIPLTMAASILVAAIVFKYWEVYWVNVGKNMVAQRKVNK